MKKISLWVGVILLQCMFSLSMIAKEQEQTIIIEEPRNHEVILNKAEVGPNVIQLWHYSGGYWGAGNKLISDDDLGRNLTDAELLAKAMSTYYTFECPISQEVYTRLIQEDELLIRLETEATNPINGETHKITDLVYGLEDNQTKTETIIDIQPNKIVLRIKPKLHFAKQTFNEVLKDTLAVDLPIVNPDFGVNSYAIWARTKPKDLGGAYGYFNVRDKDEKAPVDSGLIAPSQIINRHGHLESGFDVNTSLKGTKTTRSSEDVSVGYYTLNNGGAVGINFYYNLKLTIYSGKKPNDLSVRYDNVRTSGAQGEKITVEMKVDSSFKEDLQDVPYRWEIKDESGESLNVVYSGHIDKESGVYDIQAEAKETIAYATFVMPSTDVSVSFWVNESKENPDNELDYSNNRVVEKIKALAHNPDLDAHFIMDYDILSMPVEFSVNSGTVSVSKPSSYSWYGNLVGSVSLTHNNDSLFKHFSYTDHVVNKRSTSEKLVPKVNTTFYREDFGDNPVAGRFSDMLQEELFGTIFSSGSATRKYRKWIDTSTEEEKSGHYRYRSSTGSFPSVEKNIYVNTLIYNGMEKIYSPWFDNTIENNDRSTLKKELKWTTEPYDFTTVRWMYHLDKNGNKVNPTPLRGRIKYMDQVDKQQKKEVEIKMTTNRLFLQQINI